MLFYGISNIYHQSSVTLMKTVDWTLHNRDGKGAYQAFMGRTRATDEEV